MGANYSQKNPSRPSFWAADSTNIFTFRHLYNQFAANIGRAAGGHDEVVQIFLVKAAGVKLCQNFINLFPNYRPMSA